MANNTEGRGGALEQASRSSEDPAAAPDAGIARALRRVHGLARVRAALAHVQQAQNELGRAQQDLSAVIGYTPEWTRLGKLTSKVRDEWYRLESKLRKPARGDLGQLDGNNVDDDGMPRETEHPHAGCGGL
jgi:hypothetical protein